MSAIKKNGWLIIFVLLVLLVAGCGNDEDEQVNPSDGDADVQDGDIDSNDNGSQLPPVVTDGDRPVVDGDNPIIDGDNFSDGDVSPDGDTPVDGDLVVDGDLNPDGDSSVDGDNPSDGDSPVDGDFNPDGDSSPDGDDPIIDGDVPVDGDDPIIDGDVPVDGDDPIIDGDVPVDGDDPIIDGDEPVDGDDPIIDGDVPVDGDDPVVDGDDPVTPLGEKVLVYYGHSGVDPDGFYGYGKHGALVSRYRTAGLTVAYSDQWPADLSEHRLIVLAVPGCYDEEDLFSNAEVFSMIAFLNRGGYLYIENEKSYYSGTAVINDLLSRLGSVIRQQNDTIGSGGYYGVLTTEIGSHALMDGIDTLGFGEGSRVLPATGDVLVSYQGTCVMALESIGAGLLIVSGDQQFIDDHAFESYPPDGGDNLQFADNLAQLP